MGPAANESDLFHAQVESLARTVAPHGLHLDQGAQTRLLVFARDLVTQNERYNLMSRKDVANVVRKHIAISLAPLVDSRTDCSNVTKGATPGWLDIGTGGGFPGLVIKAVAPNLPVTLVEPSGKRCLFLERVAARMGLEVPIVQKRAETHLLRDGMAGGYRIVLSRAVTALDSALKLFGPLVAPGGLFVTFKGPQWNAEVCRALHGPGSPPPFRLTRVLSVPWTPGHILWLEKASGTA